MFMVLSLMTQVTARVHLMNVEQHQAAADPRTKTWAVNVSPLVGCYCLHPPSPFIIITQPES